MNIQRFLSVILFNMILLGHADWLQADPPDITVEAIDVYVGPSHGNPSDPVVWRGQLFFVAQDGFCGGSLQGKYGEEMYTAGIGTGPVLVADINKNTSGNCGGVSPTLFERRAAGLTDALIFRARDKAGAPSSTGFEPWRTQGNSPTTEVVANIWNGNGDSYPDYLATVLGGTRVAMSVEHGLWGREPWITDGTQPGTFPIGNIAVDDYDSNPRSFTPLNPAQFVFVATDDDTLGEELYVSDGSSSSATLVANINPALNDGSDIQLMTTFEGQSKVVFYAFDETAGREPWVSDGTPGGTFRLADIKPGIGDSNTDDDGDNDGFVQVGDLMYFSADDGINGRELWATDGTTPGTRLVKDVVAGPGGGYFARAAAFQDLLFFAAPGIGLWTSDGTEAGTTILVEGIFPGSLTQMTVVDDLMFFTSSAALWVSDGTVSGTIKVPAVFDPARGLNGLVAVGAFAVAFWARTDADGTEMFLAYKTSLLPDTTGPISGISFDAASFPLPAGENGTLLGLSSEINTGGQNVILVEYQRDGEDWLPMEPLDDGYDSPIESGIESIGFATGGTHQACVRGKDALNNIGEAVCMDIEVVATDPTLMLRAIEVNQVIQSWKNDVPLFRQKNTVVRVFVEKADVNSPVTARGLLHGSVNGNPLPGSPLLTDGGYFIDVVDDVTVIDDPATEPNESWRANIKNSLNFTLPISWTDQTGIVDLSFTLSSPLHQVLGCAEPDGAPDCEVSVTFLEAANPHIQFFSVPYRRGSEFRIEITGASGGSYLLSSGGRTSDPLAFDAGQADVEEALEYVLDSSKKRLFVWSFNSNTVHRVFTHSGNNESLGFDDSNLVGGTMSIDEVVVGGSTIAPTTTAQGDLREQVRRVWDAMPIRSVDFQLRQLNGFNDTPRVGRVNRRLETLRGIEWLFGPRGKFYGYLLGSMIEGGKGGMSWLNVSNTFAQGTQAPTKGDRARNVGVHEGSHMYGRGHAVVELQVSQTGTKKVGICGSKYNPTIANHPFVEVIAGVENKSRTTGEDRWEFTWPTIGPLSSGPDNEIWGFSPRAYRNGYDALTIVDPRNSAALMSYCNAPTTKGQDRWPSSYTYNKMHTGLLAPSGAGKPPSQTLLDTNDYIFISGYIDPDTEELVFDPVLYGTGADPGFESGELQISLFDSSDTEITSATALLLGDGDNPALSDGPGYEEQSFVTGIIIPPASNPINKIVLSIADIEIGQLLASANPPLINSFTIEASGAASGSIDINWTATDDDGDTLTATLMLSTDAGVTWTGIAMGLEGSSYLAPSATLPDSDIAQIRLLVSDGFHQAEATSAPFILDAGYPLAGIELPHPGTLVQPGASFTLRGDAWDPDDGLLADSSLQWTAWVDGPLSPATIPLGAGAILEIPASVLSDGCQEITLTATDSDGKTDTDTVVVDIGATGCYEYVFDDGFE